MSPIDFEKEGDTLDTTYLQSNLDALLDHMRVTGYSVSFVKMCRSASNYAIQLSADLSWSSYDDMRTWASENEAFCPRYRKSFQLAISIIERYDIQHELPVHPVDTQQMSFYVRSAGELDLLPLQEGMSGFEASLIEKGHHKQYAAKIKRIASKIIVTARTVAWNSFDEIREYYNNSSLADITKRIYRITISKMEVFLIGGKVPHHRNAPQRRIEDAQPSLGKLNLFELKDRLPELQKHMEEDGYTARYIRKVILRAQKLIVMAGTVKWDSYQGILDWCSEQGYGKGKMSNIRTVIRIMSAFDLFGKFPDNRATPHPLWPRKNRYQQLIPEYQDIVDYGSNAQELRGLKESSVQRGKDEVTAFLYFLQEKGVVSLENATEDDIVSFFTFGSNGIRTMLHSLSRFVRDCIPMNPMLFRRINDYIPVRHRARRTIQYLTSGECDALTQALEDMENNLNFKQRAVGNILLYTGMRASDVANLQIDSVDLQKGLMHFTQVKTGREVVLPLLPIVGNAIYDYCTMERPQSDLQYIFLGQNAPYNKITASSIGYIVSKIMDCANIRMNDGDRRGSHLFRHHVVQIMTENNVSAPVISATIGHDSPKSLDSYLSADIKHLRECAIDLGEYAIPKEVFASVSVQ